MCPTLNKEHGDDLKVCKKCRTKKRWMSLERGVWPDGRLPGVRHAEVLTRAFYATRSRDKDRRHSSKSIETQRNQTNEIERTDLNC